MAKLVFPYDKSTFTAEDEDLLGTLRPEITMLKVGLEALTARRRGEPSVGEQVEDFFGRCGGSNILRDQKINDIPNTIAGAIRNLAGTVGGVTLHTTVSDAGIAAAVTARAEKLGPLSGIEPDDSLPWMTIFGVTVLTSFEPADCFRVFKNKNIERQVVKFAGMLVRNGADAIVCSAKELAALRGFPLRKLVPGIRPTWAAANDQKRVMTPRAAAELGADFVVVGRPISNGPYPPLEAAKRINDELAKVA